jgi:hypothetical protein
VKKREGRRERRDGRGKSWEIMEKWIDGERLGLWFFHCSIIPQ